MDAAEWLGRWQALVERELAVRAQALAGPARLREAMSYSLLAGGKRLRPLLCLAAAHACGGRVEAALGPALALELVHTFSLIHDDLPCMDDDELRRGVPTCHKAFDEATALLAGDAMLSWAFELAVAGLEDDTRAARIVGAMARACGTTGMVGGQVLDLAGEGQSLGRAAMEEVHRRKTGALIIAGVELGALSVGATEPTLAALRLYGDSVGLAFQVVDDLLDVVGHRERLGKPVGGDARNQKSTYVTLLGQGGARAEATRLHHLALQALDGFGEAAEPLRMLAARAVERDH